MIISIVNNKGGTGKTTTTVNIGKALSLLNKKVLLIDLDPQANLSYSFGISTEGCILGEVLLEANVSQQDIYTIGEVDIVPSTNELIDYEYEFIKRGYPFTLFKETVATIKDKYDFILVDCPPSVSFLTVNALIGSDAVLIPMQMDVLSLQGLNQILNSIEKIKLQYNPNLYVLGVLAVLVDERRQLTNEILQIVNNEYGINVFNNYIRQNVKAAEAPSFGLSVIEYAPHSNSAQDYLNVTNEMMKIIEN
ncbi:MAG: ParA family protein [Vicingaceae bacterium]|nr:ParA family protein [Vicingaceae bacterium]